MVSGRLSSVRSCHRHAATGLRLTNAEVELDLSRSLEKVRRVVNLRRELT